MRLADALAALDARSFERLCRRRGVVVDPKKRLAPAEQAARQLADHARTVALSGPPGARAEGGLAPRHPRRGRAAQGARGGVLPLIEQDLVFTVPGSRERVAMPAELRVTLPPGPGEDRLSARALLAVQSEEVWTALGTQLFGRRPVGPPALFMGEVLERLETPAGIDELLGSLSPKQRRLLEAIEARGGQLETDELLELERSPLRVAVAGGAALPTRTAAYHLSARGLLLPRARGLWAVPTEVAERVGAVRRAVERAERQRLLARVAEDEELSPARAVLAEDPGALAVALLAALRRRGALPPDGRGVRRRELEAAAAELGAPAEQAELLVALARAAGARLEQSALSEAGAVLFATWRGTDAWDEARRDADAHRGGEELAQLATPTRALREVLLDLLEAMPPIASRPPTSWRAPRAGTCARAAPRGSSSGRHGARAGACSVSRPRWRAASSRSRCRRSARSIARGRRGPRSCASRRARAAGSPARRRPARASRRAGRAGEAPRRAGRARARDSRGGRGRPRHRVGRRADATDRRRGGGRRARSRGRRGRCARPSRRSRARRLGRGARHLRARSRACARGSRSCRSARSCPSRIPHCASG
ncbi:MAG: hypothetical protein M5U28_27255 [Sandaracinaceae bacterium]|nr:hypothetical protein [Sandaracinaceae bacterium]